MVIYFVNKLLPLLMFWCCNFFFFLNCFNWPLPFRNILSKFLIQSKWKSISRELSLLQGLEMSLVMQDHWDQWDMIRDRLFEAVTDERGYKWNARNWCNMLCPHRYATKYFYVCTCDRLSLSKWRWNLSVGCVSVLHSVCLCAQVDNV